MTSFPILWAIVFVTRIVGVAVFYGLAWVYEKRGKPLSTCHKFASIFVNIEFVLAHDFAGGFNLFCIPGVFVFVGMTSALLALIPYGICRWLTLP